MNYRRILPLALSLLSTLLAGSPYARGAEMRSFALAEVLPTNGLPPHSGVAYTLPRTRVRVAVTLVVDKVTETTENHASDGEVTTTQGPPQFEVVLDTNTLPELTITSEDDPALAFYLVSDGGFLTDITGGAITYFEGSTRINTIGVAYEDKTAEAIAGTLKLLGEVAGTVLAGLGPMSTDAKKLITRRERMEGVSAMVEEAFNLVDTLSGLETNKVITTLNLGRRSQSYKNRWASGCMLRG